MCLYVFIGADNALPLVKWNDVKPGLHVSLASDVDAATVKEWIQKPLIYDVGGNLGCACSLGFCPNLENATEEELAEYAAAREDRRELAAYLEQALTTCSEIKIYSGWDYWFSPLTRRTITTAEICGERFEFEERELITLRP